MRGGVAALLAWGQTEVALGFTVTGTPQQQHVLASWCLLGELVEGKALALGGEDALASLLSEAESTHLQPSGDVEETGVVGNGANDGDDLAVLFAAVLSDAAETDGIAVEAALIEPLVDDGVEGAIGPAGQERVQLR